MRKQPLKKTFKNKRTLNAINKLGVRFKNPLVSYGERRRLTEVDKLNAQNKRFCVENEERSTRTSNNYQILSTASATQSKETLEIKEDNIKRIKNNINKDQLDRNNKVICEKLKSQTNNKLRNISQENRIIDNKMKLCKTEPFDMLHESRNNETSINLQNKISMDKSDKQAFIKFIFRTGQSLSCEKDESSKNINKYLEQDKHLSVNMRNTQHLRKNLALTEFTDDNVVLSKSKRINRKRNSSKVVISAMESANESTVKEKKTCIFQNTEKMQFVNIDRFTEMETHDTESDDTEKRLPILKSQDTVTSESAVTKSTIGAMTMINIPIKRKVIKVDCCADYTSMKSNYTPITEKHNVLFSKGLDIAMEDIASGVMQIDINSRQKMKALKEYHLIFCVMTGTVIITVHDIIKRITNGDHFFIPCGLPYQIENVGTQKAVLSLFKIMKKSNLS